MTLSSLVTLSDGRRMPVFGLGTAYMEGTENVCLEATRQGYRMLDNANMYGNEAEVVAAVRKSGLKREDLFVVTKLHWDDHGADKTRAAIEKSLKELNVGYIDLYLIHTPGGGRNVETYDVILDYQKRGLIKSVGVSNFRVEHLKLLAESGRPAPVVNQVELHVWQRQPELVQYCRDHGIAVMGFSPIAVAKRMNDTTVIEIATGNGKTYAQVLIRWSVQRGFITIPRTSNPARLLENADVFDWSLSEEDIETLNALKLQFLADDVEVKYKPW